MLSPGPEIFSPSAVIISPESVMSLPSTLSVGSGTSRSKVMVAATYDAITRAENGNGFVDGDKESV